MQVSVGAEKLKVTGLQHGQTAAENRQVRTGCNGWLLVIMVGCLLVSAVITLVEGAALSHTVVLIVYYTNSSPSDFL